MDAYFTRLPVFNKKMKVIGYHLVMGAVTRDILMRASEPPGTALDEAICLRNLHCLCDNMSFFIDFSENLPSENSCLMKDEKVSAAVIFGKNANVNPDVCKKLKGLGFKAALHCTHIFDNPTLCACADMIEVDFPAVSMMNQYELIKQHKGRIVFIASRIESWCDFRKAADMGYEIFQGDFFLNPAESKRTGEIGTLNASLISVLRELDVSEPSFRRISSLIEHDLGLSYKLLRLANSAYMASAYKISTISQAITYLGTRELYQWISMLLLNDVKTAENAELIRMSLVRGKLMAIIAQKLGLPYSGSEPFFTGMFSLIDVILNQNMDDLLFDLPFSGEVKNALLGKDNELQMLLSFVTDYEQGRFKKLEGRYPMEQVKPENMVLHYFEALKWSRADAL